MPANATILTRLKPHEVDSHPEAPFTTAGEAWLWATEVLRRRRLPSTSPMWRDSAPAPRGWKKEEPSPLNLMAEATQVAENWGKRWRAGLPHDAEGRQSLALQIQLAADAVRTTNAEAAHILTLWAWGDWADEARLRGALAVQEKARREGMRVRLSYRYSSAQLASLLGLSKTAAWRKLHAALAMLEKELQAHRLVPPADDASRPAETKTARTVTHTDFQDV
jgi:hypothetical protein